MQNPSSSAAGFHPNVSGFEAQTRVAPVSGKNAEFNEFFKRGCCNGVARTEQLCRHLKADMLPRWSPEYKTPRDLSILRHLCAFYAPQRVLKLRMPSWCFLTSCSFCPYKQRHLFERLKRRRQCRQKMFLTLTQNFGSCLCHLSDD